MKKEYDISELATMKAFYEECLKILAKEDTIHREEDNLVNYMKSHRRDIPLEVRSWFGDLAAEKDRELRTRRRYLDERINMIEKERYDLEAKIMRICGDDEDRGIKMIETYRDLYDAKYDEERLAHGGDAAAVADALAE